MSRAIAEVYVSAARLFFREVHACGSYRRGKASIRDLDLAIVGEEFEERADLFGRATGATWQCKGPRKAILTTEYGHQIDLNWTEPASLGALMMEITGSAQFNVTMRCRAKHLGLRLSRYGLFDGGTILTADEAGIFNYLNVPYRAPEARNG
jgi:DNA polymerase (family 10)